MTRPTAILSARRSMTIRGRAFTLIELLVVIAIIALLIGILIPALGSARETGRNIKCQAHIRGQTQALIAYSVDYKGLFPPILHDAPDPETGKLSMIWYDEARIGRYLPQTDDTNILPSNTRSNTVGGGIMRCPNHPDAGRSYTMNFWAASAGSWQLNTSGRVVGYKPGYSPFDPTEAARGRAFDSTVDNASQTLLMTEAWGLFSSEAGIVPKRWFSIGQVGVSALPAQRFGAGFGVSNPGSFPGDWFGNAPEMNGLTSPGELRSYIPFYRHPRQKSGLPTEKKGSVNFALADGHVGQYKYSDLVDGNNQSTRKVVWSPKDWTLPN
ncbi:MAG TPA: prepilin-type N-terminal cleavage/methylation domain-containing protein [Phycisphaerales bacterium]|nr:prepilin-type N-terminal cleavage/methylation domain-containing protein [Phycisphaerales bacterium]